MRQIGRILGGRPGRQTGDRARARAHRSHTAPPPSLPPSPSLFSSARVRLASPAVAPQMKNYSLKTRREERRGAWPRPSEGECASPYLPPPLPPPTRRREPPRKEGMIIAGYKLKRSVKLGVNAIPVVQVHLPPVTLARYRPRPLIFFLPRLWVKTE